MDDLVDWMIRTGMADTRPLFEQAVAGGIASVAEALQPLREFFIIVETPPDWLDEATLRRGERVLRRGGYDGLYLARDVSLSRIPANPAGAALRGLPLGREQA